MGKVSQIRQLLSDVFGAIEVFVCCVGAVLGVGVALGYPVLVLHGALITAISFAKGISVLEKIKEVER